MTPPLSTYTQPDRDAIRLIALDVDGTVLTPDHTISLSTRDAISKARTSGVVVVLASSRSPFGLQPILDELDLANQWFIGYQGALVGRWTDSGDLATLNEVRIDQSTARTIERQALEASLSVSRYTGTRWLVLHRDAAITREASITGEQPVVLTSDQLDHDMAPHKLLIIAHPIEDIPRLTHLSSALPPNVTATFSHPNYLEVTAAGVDKACGIVKLATHLDIDLDYTAAVGDGLNDLAMFAAVKISVAMGQSPQAVKEAATRATFSNSDEGLAQALHDLLNLRPDEARPGP